MFFFFDANKFAPAVSLFYGWEWDGLSRIDHLSHIMLFVFVAVPKHVFIQRKTISCYWYTAEGFQ